MAPSQLHMFEVYADEQCTIRPRVGESYNTLYLQVNAEVQQQCPNPDYIQDEDAVRTDVCPEGFYEREELILFLFTDFTVVRMIYSEGVDMTLHTGVYKCVYPDELPMQPNFKISSGPVIAQ